MLPFLSAVLLSGPLLASAAVIPRADTSVVFGGQTFINKGLVGFGVVPADLRDSLGDTIGGIGSAIAIKKGTFKLLSNGSYVGTLVTQPDRGYNVETTIDYQGRLQYFDFILSPYTSSKKLSYKDGKKTFQLTYRSTSLTYDRSRARTTGLDALAVRAPSPDYPSVLTADPAIPIASSSYDFLSLDAEGLAFNADGSYFTSDEYGPYIYRFSADGNLISTIQPPQAVLPYVDGALNFSSADDPDTGRSANQGFEGLTLSTDGNTLYALLQSAVMQDGGGDRDTNRYTRLFAYDVSDAQRGTLIGEWVVPLPLSEKKGKTLQQSELHYLNSKQFLVLARDSDGRGTDDKDYNSAYKSADLIDITDATDIHGTKYDALTAVAPDGKLVSSVTPAAYASFVSYVDDKQLARFGLQNGGDNDKTLIDSKWESLALAPALDPAYPDDYLLFTVADNDFITEDGSYNGQSYSASYGADIDTQAFVFRVTLPTVERGSIEQSLGI